MDQHRLRAYLTLIQELLRCPSGEELALLQANAEIIDAQFVKVMEVVASQAEEQGALGAANYLRNLAQQLKQAIEEATETDDHEEDNYSAYLKLIEDLLGCPSGAEPDILRAHQELIDPSFVLILKQVAGILAEIGENKASNYLQSIATPLTEALNHSSSVILPEQYLDFLGDVLRATGFSNGDASVVYPLLQANQDKLNKHFLKVLQTWAKDTLAEVKPQVAQNIAVDIANFSTLIQQFSLGNQSDNLEIAIAGYEIALTILTPDRFQSFPEEWARIQYHLGNAYSQRICGNNMENLELAIKCYRNALEVFAKD